MHTSAASAPIKTGGLYERTAPEWQGEFAAPDVGTIVARCDPIADKTVRRYTAVVEVAPEGKYALKVLYFDGSTVYEQLYDYVIDSWLLTKDRFMYQERYSDNRITYVRLPFDDDEEESKEEDKVSEVQVSHFKLPADLVIEDRIQASLEPFVEAHPNEDK